MERTVVVGGKNARSEVPMSARFCSQCGASLREESRFCASCGASTDGSPASAPAAPARSEFLVKSGFAKTRLVIAEGLLTVDVDAVPPALGRRFRTALIVEVAALIILAVVLSAAGAADKGSAGSVILGLCLFVGLIGTPLVYWTVIRSKHQLFTVVAPLASIERLSVGTANPVIMVALWLCLGLPGLFYYIWTTRYPTVVVYAPFVLGPDKAGKLGFRCENQAETRRLIDLLKPSPKGRPRPQTQPQASV
jgi:zinc-ribbon domain